MRRKRVRRSEREWRELLTEQSTSGKSLTRFAADKGIASSSMHLWSKRLALGSASSTRTGASYDSSARVPTIGPSKVQRAEGRSMFAQVQVVELPRASSGLLEVVTRDGYVVRVHGEVDARALSALLEALGRC